MRGREIGQYVSPAPARPDVVAAFVKEAVMDATDIPAAVGQWPKHFLYISPSKVDSIFYQIEAKLLRDLAKKLTIDLKVVKVEFASAEHPDTLYSRLRIVLDYLASGDLIGTIDHPGPYVAGALEMRWGPFAHASVTQEGLVYFGGETPETTLGLGGSLENVFGNVGASPTHSHSATPALLEALTQGLEPDELERALSDISPEELIDRVPRDHEDVSDEDWTINAVETANAQMRDPLQPVEFVAKRLLWGDTYASRRKGKLRTLLGSPLYVALDE